MGAHNRIPGDGSPSPEPEQPSSKEKEHDGTAGKLELLEAALNAQSARTSFLWGTMVTSGIYLMSSLGSITDRHRLLLNEIKLPIVGIDINLVSFLIGGPIVFCALQLYVLYKVILLISTIDCYGDRLDPRHREDWALKVYWHRLDLFFVPRLFMPGRTNDRLILGLITTVCMAGLVATPLFVLIGFYCSSLPMRVTSITLFQALTLLSSGACTVITILVLQKRAQIHRWAGLRRTLRYLTVFVAIAVPSVVLLLPWLRAGAGLRTPGFTASVTASAPAGQVLDLHNRKLRHAVLTDARLENANLDGADLSGADLTGANLSGANLRGAILDEATLSKANLTGANLTEATLIKARMDQVVAIGASLNAADLTGADLKKAVLRGARMLFATLNGVDLSPASLHMALLDYAELSVNTLEDTDLTAVSCRFCTLRVRTMARVDVKALEGTDVYGLSLLMGADDEGPWCSLASDESTRIGDGGRTGAAPRLDPQIFSELGIGNTDKVRQRVEKRWKLLAGLPGCGDSVPPFVPWGVSVLRNRILNEACNPMEYAPYQARAVLLRLRRPVGLFGDQIPDDNEVVRTLLDPGKCPGARGLTTTERETLLRYTNLGKP